MQTFSLINKCMEKPLDEANKLVPQAINEIKIIDIDFRDSANVRNKLYCFATEQCYEINKYLKWPYRRFSFFQMG